MKKVLLVLAMTAIGFSAFAQGKIGMVNDSTRAVYMDPTKSFLSADQALAGERAPLNGVLPSGVTLVVDLYAGYAADLSDAVLQQTTVMSATILGGFGPRNFISPNIAGGDTYYGQVKVRDNAYLTAEAAETAGSYYGYSQIFTARASSTLAYFNINNTLAANAQSTWLPGTYDMGGGVFGAIGVGIIPEPSTFALAGLGAAALLIFRRRK